MLRLLLFMVFFCSQLTASNHSFIVGIAGGSGSGKTTLANKLLDALGEDAILIQQDAYYKDLSHLSVEERKERNFDHPEAIDFDLLCEHLIALKHQKAILVPTYDFTTHKRTAKEELKNPAKVIIVEGILILAIPKLRELLDIKIFTEVGDDIRLLRRLDRDIHERGRDLESIKNQYLATVKPMFEQYVAPSKDHADLLIPCVSDTGEAEKIIISRLKT
jgi:uridine kinase